MTLSLNSDEHFMKLALMEAELAYEKGEVPVGAVIVSRDKVIARSHNLTEALMDVTAHAEMQAITSASNHLGGKYLQKCSLYVTLEPCAMCAGALFWSQIGKVVYGASDPKRGFTNHKQAMLHPKTEIKVGVLAEACSQILQQFFKERRAK